MNNVPINSKCTFYIDSGNIVPIYSDNTSYKLREFS